MPLLSAEVAEVVLDRLEEEAVVQSASPASTSFRGPTTLPLGQRDREERAMVKEAPGGHLSLPTSLPWEAEAGRVGQPMQAMEVVVEARAETQGLAALRRNSLRTMSAIQKTAMETMVALFPVVSIPEAEAERAVEETNPQATRADGDFRLLGGPDTPVVAEVGQRELNSATTAEAMEQRTAIRVEPLVTTAVEEEERVVVGRMPEGWAIRASLSSGMGKTSPYVDLWRKSGTAKGSRVVE